MNKKLVIFLIVFLGYFSLLQAQTITGTVTAAEDGLPIPGVTVVLEGFTGSGGLTDFDGNYSIDLVEGATTLVFSFIGMETQKLAINGQSVINVVLKTNDIGIDEVIVVGYGTQKVANVSGAISTIKAEDIDNKKPLRVEEALQGQTSGVSVIQNGSPGSKPTVLVRGIPSFSGTDPVVIIDGVPQSLDDLNSINSSDIASISVLKDASATAIYGVKGGNGVIVVTTKSGKKNEKVQISFNSYFGQQEVTKKIGVLNASEYGAMLNEGSVTSGGELIFPDLSVLGVGTDWQSQIFEKANVSSNNLSLSGGSENVSYFISAGNLSQDGIVGGGDNSNFKRANITANVTYDLSKKVKLILNTSYVNISSVGVQENSFNSVIGSALNFDPTVSVLNTDPNSTGKYGYSNLLLSEIFNPLTKLDNSYNESNGNKIFGKGEIQYKVLDNLTVSSRLGYVKWDQVGKSFTPLVFYGPLNVENTMQADGTAVSETVNGISIPRHNSVNEYSNSNFNFTFETFANYSLTLQEVHNIDVVAGFSMSRSTSSGFSASRQDVPFNSWDFADISSATGINSIIVPASIDENGNLVPAVANLNAQSGSSWQGLTRRNMSYFARVNYDYEGKYLASFSARRDGSMAFGADNKFANFYAGSLGWLVSEESFFDVSFIDHLKVRGSFGSVGNENVTPQYVAISTGGPSYAVPANSNGYTFGSSFVPGSTVNSFDNTTLSWEKQLQWNTGFDIILFNDKISFSADYFNKSVDGLLFTNPSPLYAGTSMPVQANIGSTESKGFDLTLKYNNTFFENLKVSTSLTYTTSNNLVTETNSDGTAFISGGSYFNGQSQNATRFEKGYSPGYFYGYVTDGLFQNEAEIEASPTQDGAVPGDIKFKDINGDNIINDLDRTKIGDPFADFTVGWNLGLEYKNFSLNVFTYASVGNDIYRAYERNAQYSNKFRNVLDRWTGEGSTNDATTPRYSFTDANSNIRPSDRYVEDGSFIKIKNLTLNYTIPSSIYKEKVFKELGVYVQVKNLHTFTNYTGYDPEIPGGILDTGVDRGTYPQARTISAGIKMKF